MKDLREKVQEMLDGEKKRREIAIKFLEEVTEILSDVGEDIWGTGVTYVDGFETYTVDVKKIDKDGKVKDSGLYFRYKMFGTDRGKDEYRGFYEAVDGQMNLWGKEVLEMRGKDFWYAVQVIIDWIPQVIEAMDKRQISRDELLKKINIA